jgi:hypothetical protein
MSNQVISVDRYEYSPTEPVTLAQAKNQLTIDFTDDDTKITSLITQCRRAIENFCHISIVRQQITAYLFFDSENELPYGPVTDIIEVSVSSGATGSGPVAYETATDSWNFDGGGFKTFQTFTGLRYRLIYWAGYMTVPEDLKLAILTEIAYRYENRGDTFEQKTQGICEAARILALPYKRYLWF